MTAYANAHLERLVRTTRPECLDWLLILNEYHLCQVLAEYFDHYSHARSHPALELPTPASERGPGTGPVVRLTASTA